MDISQKIADEAAGWMVALQEKPGDDQCRQGFERWLDQSQEHRKAWERLQIAWQAFGATVPVFQDAWKDAPRRPEPARGYHPRRSGAWRRAGLVAAAATVSRATSWH